MQVKEFDVVILGGGPAGLSAGMYAARGNVSTAIVDINMLGGQPSNYLDLENYPGFSKIGGYELMEKFEEHADKFGIQKFAMLVIVLFVMPRFIKIKLLRLSVAVILRQKKQFILQNLHQKFILSIGGMNCELIKLFSNEHFITIKLKLYGTVV